MQQKERNPKQKTELLKAALRCQVSGPLLSVGEPRAEEGSSVGSAQAPLDTSINSKLVITGRALVLALCGYGEGQVNPKHSLNGVRASYPGPYGVRLLRPRHVRRRAGRLDFGGFPVRPRP